MPFSGALDYIGSVVGDVGTGIENAASAVGTAVGDAASAVGTGLSDAASAVGNAIGLTGDTAAATGATDVAATPAASAVTTAEPIISSASPGAGVSAAASAAPAGVDAVDPLAEGGATKSAVDSSGGWSTSSSTPSSSDWTTVSGGSNGPGGSSTPTPSLKAIGSDIGGGNYGQALSDVGSKLSANSNWLMPAASLGATALLGNTAAKGTTQVSQAAAQLSTAGQQLQTYLTTGTLPAGVQASINSASESAKAAVRSQYAKMGMSGSSAEMADLQHVDTVATTQGTDIALKLMQQGVADTQISAQLYGELMNNAMASDKNLVSALSALASSSARASTTGG